MKTKAQLKELFLSKGVNLSLFHYLEKYGDQSRVRRSTSSICGWSC